MRKNRAVFIGRNDSFNEKRFIDKSDPEKQVRIRKVSVNRIGRNSCWENSRFDFVSSRCRFLAMNEPWFQRPD